METLLRLIWVCLASLSCSWDFVSESSSQPPWCTIIINHHYHQIQLEWSDVEFPALLERIRGAADLFSDVKEVRTCFDVWTSFWEIEGLANLDWNFYHSSGPRKLIIIIIMVSNSLCSNIADTLGIKGAQILWRKNRNGGGGAGLSLSSICTWI